MGLQTNTGRVSAPLSAHTRLPWKRKQGRTEQKYTTGQQEGIVPKSHSPGAETHTLLRGGKHLQVVESQHLGTDLPSTSLLPPEGAHPALHCKPALSYQQPETPPLQALEQLSWLITSKDWT